MTGRGWIEVLTEDDVDSKIPKYSDSFRIRCFGFEEDYDSFRRNGYTTELTIYGLQAGWRRMRKLGEVRTDRVFLNELYVDKEHLEYLVQGIKLAQYYLDKLEKEYWNKKRKEASNEAD